MRHFIYSTTAAAALFMAAAPAKAELTLFSPEERRITEGSLKSGELVEGRRNPTARAATTTVFGGGFVDTRELNFTDENPFLIAKDSQNDLWIGINGTSPAGLTDRYYMIDSNYPGTKWYISGFTDVQVAQAVQARQIMNADALVKWAQDNKAAQQRIQALIDAERKK